MVRKRGVKGNGSRKVSRSGRALVKNSSKPNNSYVALGIAVFLVFVLAVGFFNGNTTTGKVITGNDITIVYTCIGGGQASTPQGCPNGVSSQRQTGSSSSSSSSSGFSFSGMLDQWNQGTLDTVISKYFIFFMLLILIYSIFHWGGFPPGGFLQLILALFVSFFATGYIVPRDLIGIMQVYSALGLTLTVILPFIVLMFFSAMMVTGTRKITVGQLLISRFIWFLFAGFLIYRMIMLWNTEGFAVTATLIVTIVAFILSLLTGIFFKKFSNSMFKMLRLSKIENLKREKLDRELAASARVTTEHTND